MNLIRKYYVKKMVKQIDKSIKVKFGKALQCEPTANTIYVAFKTNQVDKKTFMDYVKVGLPLQIIMGIVMVLVLPLIFPFN